MFTSDCQRRNRCRPSHSWGGEPPELLRPWLSRRKLYSKSLKSLRLVTARKTAEFVPFFESASGAAVSGTPVQPAPPESNSEPLVTSQTGDGLVPAALGCQCAYSLVIRPSGRPKSSVKVWALAGAADSSRDAIRILAF